LRQVSLDEPCRQKDGRSIRRDYGIRDEQLAGTVDRIALARAIRELPVGYRTIFLLHEVEGYEHQEIARLLDCSVGNSKSQLHKAKQRIQELLSVRQEGASVRQAVPRRQRKSKSTSIDQRLKIQAAKDNFSREVQALVAEIMPPIPQGNSPLMEAGL